MSTPDGEEVQAEGFVIAKTTYYNGTTNLYIAGSQSDEKSTTAEGYYVYNYECSQDEYNKLVVNHPEQIFTYVTVAGTKASYAGMQEIIDAKVTIESSDATFGSLYIHSGEGAGVPLDVVQEQYMAAAFFGTLKVKEYTTTDQNATVAENKAYGYKGDTPTDDLYFILEDEAGNELSCCVEAYVDYSAFGSDHKKELYQNVMSLQVGDTVEVSGFLYWWNGPNPHIIQIQKVNP